MIEKKAELNIHEQDMDTLKFLEDLSSTDEQIVSILSHNAKPFIITLYTVYSMDGLLSDINFYGYILDFDHTFTRNYMMHSHVIYAEKEPGIDYVELCDNFCITQNQGYGSLMMHAYLKYIKKLRIKHIEVTLVCNEHKEKESLIQFYKKFGFKYYEETKMKLILHI